MPTYQYACTECGHEFEAFQSFTDNALSECPVCGGKLRKVYGSVGVVFKGSGFYRTDSRNGDGTVKAGPNKEKAASSGGDSGSSSESSGTSSSTKESSKTSTPKESAGTSSSAAPSGGSSSTSSTSGSKSSGTSSSS